MSYVPSTVYEREGRTERAWDIYSRLLRDRIIFIGTPINDFVANAVIAQMLFLQMEDPKKILASNKFAWWKRDRRDGYL